jgi:hypothetical protein
MTLLKRYLLPALCFALMACTPPPPKHQTNVCEIFREYPSWYWAALDSQRKWGVPISTQMAIIHQESHFDGKAKPPRGKILWVIPWSRPTSATGYSQAVNQTWKTYQKETDSHYSSRNEFDAATDFLGWYLERAHKRLGLPKNNTYDMYLAYHEGIGGFSRGSYKKKNWLINVAKKVQRQADTYHYQLVRCQNSLPKKPWYNFWS